ncbi:siroheme synthase [Arcobacter sp. CECT 8986]|uniref:precorrin-2 dehydrogenase/sirohydrochlorin ferrochelatase family protein n=1 Tax=Arcobacter sp. CECT 8986 TaxID=2044507 RepID=UPI001009B3E8|nr:bifunctional precorrin-2 dehydrogenase/sirohydrochlorin ferrochelatase [Arcobacter sp. CECT 8986]RXJ99188.1 siroheme synthase [Arcobacter sp. CECT 8986]
MKNYIRAKLNYLPTLLNLENKNILVIGGGVIAHRKILSLLDFSTNITVISKEITEELKELIDNYKLTYLQDNYNKGYLQNIDILVVAVDDLKLQEEIYLYTRNKKVLCNFVDFKEYSDFIFPSIIKKGDITVSIATNGQSPAITKELKNYIKSLIPNDIDKFLNSMKVLRNSLPKGEKRMSLLRKKAQEYFNSLKK